MSSLMLCLYSDFLPHIVYVEGWKGREVCLSQQDCIKSMRFLARKSVVVVLLGVAKSCFDTSFHFVLLSVFVEMQY